MFTGRLDLIGVRLLSIAQRQFESFKIPNLCIAPSNGNCLRLYLQSQSDNRLPSAKLQRVHISRVIDGLVKTGLPKSTMAHRIDSYPQAAQLAAYSKKRCIYSCMYGKSDEGSGGTHLSEASGEDFHCKSLLTRQAIRTS
jgi:hypothetical protein